MDFFISELEIATCMVLAFLERLSILNLTVFTATVKNSTVISRLTSLFNKTLVTGVMPSNWQTSLVTPIHKKGSKHDCANCRSVSLTKRLVRDKILLHLTRNSLLTDTQHGFMPKRSTLTNLLCLRMRITRF